jgi:eukaryotic-like serine/threonine-protein kinase
MDLKKGAQIGPFVIIDSLRRGGMAEVYIAYAKNPDGEEGTPVVLKISRIDSQHPRYGNALKLEVDIISRLSHPYIIKAIPLPLGTRSDPFVARAVEMDGHPWFYAMEYLRGGALAGYLKQGKKLPLDLSSKITLCLIDAVAYLHSMKIAHLDIKPENVLLRSPLVKGAPIEPILIDFGVAARTIQGDATGGTLIAMSPEYLKKSKGLTAPEITIDLAKVDIYALGVAIYRMWTGQYPFGGMTERSLTSSIMNTVPQPPHSINPALPRETDQLIMYWLAKDPRDRPSLAEIKEQLAVWGDGLSQVPDTLHPPQSNGWFPFRKK